MPFTLLMPWALLLLVPAALVWWRWLRVPHFGAYIRLLALIVLVIAAAGPRLRHGFGGSDVVVILDRSASMDSARATQPELLRLIGDQRKTDDRLAVIAVGDEATIAQAPQGEGLPDPSRLQVDDQASDLASGLRLARSLIGAERSGRIVLVSDGEDTGVGLRAAAATCAAAGIPVDIVPVQRPGQADAAILDVELPGELRHGESFTGAARLISDLAETRTWTVRRGETVIASGSAALLPLQPVTITFSDRPPQPRLTSYTIDLDARDDQRPANNRAVGALRVTGGERVLVIGGDGTPGNISRALTAAGMHVQCRAEGPVSLAELTGSSVVVLEQVPADRLGNSSMEAIAQWVEHLGGGLVLTGGKRGFGAGGYHRSPIERVSPVTMEIRDEQRKLSVAMVITMDRSGSMGAPAGPGRTKMDLADEGACAAIELLGPLDQIAVHAVDSTAHPIVGLTRIGNQRSAIMREVRGIVSQGGGIYVYTALLEAGNEIVRATAGTRHIVLFADANDAEEPGDYQRLLASYRANGITVSVVAMGTPKDSDAAFLENVAKLGGGRILYASEPADIPRLFAQETVLISRTAWVDGAVTPVAKPGLDLVVPGFTTQFPTIPGYNLTYIRDRAQLLAWNPGDPPAPAAAAWRIGTGHAVAIPIDCDGPAATSLVTWAGYAPWLAGVTRWAAGTQGDLPGAITVERTGRTAVLRLEIDPREATRATVSPLVHLADADGREAQSAPWQRVDHHVWEALMTLDEHAVIPAAAIAMDTDVRAIAGPALCLPVSPEVEPRYGRIAGDAVLTAIARETGGTVRADVAGIYRNPASPGSGTDLAWWLGLLGLIILIGEIALRRWQMSLWGVKLPTRKLFPRRNNGAPPVTKSLPVSPTPAAPLPPGNGPESTLQDALSELNRRRKR